MFVNIQVNIQVYIDIYIRVSLGGHNLVPFFARKMKFSMLLTQTQIIWTLMIELPLGHALGLG